MEIHTFILARIANWFFRPFLDWLLGYSKITEGQLDVLLKASFDKVSKHFTELKAPLKSNLDEQKIISRVKGRLKRKKEFFYYKPGYVSGLLCITT